MWFNGQYFFLLMVQKLMVQLTMSDVSFAEIQYMRSVALEHGHMPATAQAYPAFMGLTFGFMF